TVSLCLAGKRDLIIKNYSLGIIGEYAKPVNHDCQYQHTVYGMVKPHCYGLCKIKAGNETYGSFEHIGEEDQPDPDPPGEDAFKPDKYFDELIQGLTCESREYGIENLHTSCDGTICQSKINAENCRTMLIYETLSGDDGYDCQSSAYKGCKLLTDTTCTSRRWICERDHMFMRQDSPDPTAKGFIMQEWGLMNNASGKFGVICCNSVTIQPRFKVKNNRSICEYLLTSGAAKGDGIRTDEKPSFLIEKVNGFKGDIVTVVKGHHTLPVLQDKESDFIGIAAFVIFEVIELAVAIGGLGIGSWDYVQIKRIQDQLKNLEKAINTDIDKISDAINTDRVSFRELQAVVLANSIATNTLLIQAKINELAVNSTEACRILKEAGLDATEKDGICVFHYEIGKLLEDLYKVNTTKVVIPKIVIDGDGSGGGILGKYTDWIILALMPLTIIALIVSLAGICKR
ncbi:putative hemagglutinin, partial [Steelhead trout orthomyxovirus-1]